MDKQTRDALECVGQTGQMFPTLQIGGNSADRARIVAALRVQGYVEWDRTEFRYKLTSKGRVALAEGGDVSQAA
jgi:DNA-binding IclR family transcriptional regulator